MKGQPFPGRISALIAQERVRKHLGARVNVFVDDQFSFALSAQLVFKHGLRPDFEISAAFLEQLLREDGENKAFLTACNFLGHRARSEGEIRARLARDEWSETVIVPVLARLRELKLVDDADFAQNWVENRGRSRPRGARALQQELRQKGVARETIEESLPDAAQEIQNALLALQKTARKWEALDEKIARQKALEFLARRGFGFGAARDAWNLWREDE